MTKTPENSRYIDQSREKKEGITKMFTSTVLKIEKEKKDYAKKRGLVDQDEIPAAEINGIKINTREIGMYSFKPHFILTRDYNKQYTETVIYRQDGPDIQRAISIYSDSWNVVVSSRPVSIDELESVIKVMESPFLNLHQLDELMTHTPEEIQQMKVSVAKFPENVTKTMSSFNSALR